MGDIHRAWGLKYLSVRGRYLEDLDEDYATELHELPSARFTTGMIRLGDSDFRLILTYAGDNLRKEGPRNYSKTFYDLESGKSRTESREKWLKMTMQRLDAKQGLRYYWKEIPWIRFQRTLTELFTLFIQCRPPQIIRCWNRNRPPTLEIT